MQELLFRTAVVSLPGAVNAGETGKPLRYFGIANANIFHGGQGNWKSPGKATESALTAPAPVALKHHAQGRPEPPLFVGAGRVKAPWTGPARSGSTGPHSPSPSAR